MTENKKERSYIEFTKKNRQKHIRCLNCRIFKANLTNSVSEKHAQITRIPLKEKY